MAIVTEGVIPAGTFKVSGVRMRNKDLKIVSIHEVAKLSDGKGIVCVYKGSDKKNRLITYFNNGHFLKDKISDFDLVTVLERV